MDECITYIGLDVQKETIAVALVEGNRRGQVCEHGQESTPKRGAVADLGVVWH